MSNDWPPDEITVSGREYVAKDTICRDAGTEGVEEVFTVEQVSEMSGVSKRTIYSLMDRHVLAYTVPNGCKRPRLVRRSEYERWMGVTR